MDAVLLKTPQLVYALREGKLVSVDDVESGLKCGCQCPSCEAPLIARKGKHNQHSFAHASGHGCEYGLETSLHLAAKEILSQTDYIWLPELRINDQVIRESEQLKVIDAEVEKKIEDIIPDVLVKSWVETYMIEICVTHPVDDIKLEKLKRLKIPTVEIKIDRDGLTPEMFRDRVLNLSEHKYWVYHPDMFPEKAVEKPAILPPRTLYEIFEEIEKSGSIPVRIKAYDLETKYTMVIYWSAITAHLRYHKSLMGYPRNRYVNNSIVHVYDADKPVWRLLES